MVVAILCFMRGRRPAEIASAHVCERGLVVRALHLFPGSSPPPCHWTDLSSVAPNSTPALFNR